MERAPVRSNDRTVFGPEGSEKRNLIFTTLIDDSGVVSEALTSEAGTPPPMETNDLWFLDTDPQTNTTIRVRLLSSVEELVDEYPEFLELSLTAEDLPRTDESRRGFNRFLIDFEERARHFLEKVGDSILIAIRRVNDSCILFFYAHSREVALKRFSQLQGTITTLPLALEIRPDPEWSEYRSILAATGNS